MFQDISIFILFFFVFVNCIWSSVGNLCCNVWQQSYVMRMVPWETVLACLSGVSRFYCHAQHHAKQVLTGPSDLQRQGLRRHSVLLRLVFRGLLLCASEEIYLITAVLPLTLHLRWNSSTAFRVSGKVTDLDENCIRCCSVGWHSINALTWNFKS